MMLRFLFCILLLFASPVWGSVTVSINTANGDAVTDTYSTTSSSVTLAGTVSTNSGTIERLVWDNIDTDNAGITLEVSQPSGYPFTTAAIALKSGPNEILLTGTNSVGEVGTDKITVTKTASGPTISSVSVNDSTIRVYEKYEITFSLDTCASTKYYLWEYDASTPTGITASKGVTAYARFSRSGADNEDQPAFYYHPVTLSGDWWDGHYVRSGTPSWKVRFSPQTAGTYTVTLYAQDSCGTTSYAISTPLVVSLPATDGFVQVSGDDGRFFKRSSGKIFWPVGPADIQSNGYASYSGTGTNLTRPWMAGQGAFSTNWSTWLRADSNYAANEGADQPLTYYDYYPSSELSRVITAADGNCGFLIPGAWSGYSYGQYNPRFSNTTYLIKLRLKTSGITGGDPWGRGAGNYGLVLKQHNFNDGLGSTCDNGGYYDASVFSQTNLLGGYIKADRGWHTIVVTATFSSSYDHISLYLENCSAGTVYVDQLSIKESLGGGLYGPELMRHSRSDIHTYVEDLPAYYFDQQVSDAETNGVFLKWIVQDKNDWIPNHIDYASGKWVYNGSPTANGSTTQMICTNLLDADDYYNGMTLTVTFTGENSTYARTVSNFDQASGTITVSSAFPFAVNTDDTFSLGTGYVQGSGSAEGKWRWLQKQWWRYLAARWGYSPAVHSWEHCNEAPPNETTYWSGADEFAEYMHSIDSHPHLACTSFSSSYVSGLYNERATYPNVDYADVHHYRAHGYFEQDDDDLGKFMIAIMTEVVSGTPEIPVLISEVGVTGCDGYLDPPSGPDGCTNQWAASSVLEGAGTNAQTAAYHNAIWATLHPEAGYLGQYWWPSEHFPASYWNISTGFKNFIANSDLHKGGYVDSSASCSAGAIVYGRMNTTKRKAVLWLRNSNYYWDYIRTNSDSLPATTAGNITLTMNASTKYIVERWSTTAGTIAAYSTITSNGSGLLTIPYTGITSDAAYKIYPAEWPTAGYNNSRHGVTPENIGGTRAAYWNRSFSYENISLSTQVITGGGRAYIGTTGNGTGSGSFAGKLHALNPADGATDLWTYSGVTGGFAAALVYDDYLGGTVFGGTTYGEVVAINASTGAERWRVTTGRPGGFNTAPLIENDTLILTGRDGYVYAYTLGGTLIWEKDIGVPIQNTPAAYDGIVYFVSEDIIAHALYVSSGEYVSGWPSAQFYGGSARCYWPVLTDSYMIFTSERPLQRASYFYLEPELCECSGDYCCGAWNLSCTDSSASTYRVPQVGFRNYLDGTSPANLENLHQQTMFALTRSTGLKTATVLNAGIGGGGPPNSPPIVRTNGDIVVEYYAPCSVWDYDATIRHCAMGYLNPSTGNITSQIVPSTVTWNHFRVIGDETAAFSGADDLIFAAPTHSWGGYSFTTNETFGCDQSPPAACTYIYGANGYFGPSANPVSWHRQEWNGTCRNPISVGAGVGYFLVGGRIYAFQ